MPVHGRWTKSVGETCPGMHVEGPCSCDSLMHSVQDLAPCLTHGPQLQTRWQRLAAQQLQAAAQQWEEWLGRQARGRQHQGQERQRLLSGANSRGQPR
jgi:hypothetical protein